MVNWKKVVVLMTAVVALGLVVIGCGSDDSSSAATEAVDEAVKSLEDLDLDSATTPEQAKELLEEAKQAQESVEEQASEAAKELEEVAGGNAEELCIEAAEETYDGEQEKVAVAQCKRVY